jgi:hypothetical protein
MQPISSAFNKLVVRRLSVHLERGDSPAFTLTEIRKMINNQKLADAALLESYSNERFIVPIVEDETAASNQMNFAKMTIL